MVTTLVGRGDDLATVLGLVRARRLVTLVGPAGVGKSGLARAVVDAYPDGVLIDLGGPARTRLSWRVRSSAAAHRADLLVLDNVDHRVAEVAERLSELLSDHPGLRVLVTSREPLRLAAECRWPVPTLAVGAPGQWTTPEAALEIASIRLFADRAVAINPDFLLTRANVAAVGAVCARLDGLPLAIELAADRMAVLPVEDLAAHWDRAARLLDLERHHPARRHRSMRASLQWSFDLLDDRERLLFGRLGVFAGGFDRECAEVVCGGAPLTPGEVLPLLSQLVDRSLVLVTTGPRYSMLETIRRYAAQHLEASGAKDAIRRRHAKRQLDLADRMDVDRDNLNAALTWAATHWPEGLVRLVAGTRFWWALRGHYAEGHYWLRRAVRAGVGTERDRATVLGAAGTMAMLSGQHAQAAEWLGAALESYERTADRHGAARTVDALAALAREQARYDAADALIADATARWRELGDEAQVQWCRLHRGFVAWLRGDPRTAHRESVGPTIWFRRSGDRRRLTGGLINLGAASLYSGQLANANRHLAEALELSRAIGFPGGAARALGLLGRAARLDGDPDRAESLVGQAATIHHDLGDLSRVADDLEHLGVIAADQERHSTAARLLGAAEAVRSRLGIPGPPCEQPDVDRARSLVDAALPPVLLASARAEGACADLGELVAVRRPDDSRTLVVQAFGAARETRDGRPLGPADWTYRKPRELLYFLLSGPARGKAEIGLALWPEASAEVLRNSLHTAIRQLRRALGGREWVTYRGGRYGFNRALPYVFDVEVFETGMAAAEAAPTGAERIGLLERTLAGYTGDFLADLAGCRWIEERRLLLRRRAEHGLRTLSGLLLAAGEPGQAAEVCLRLLALDELSEPAHRQLMECYAAMGDPGRALRHYTDLSGRLADELGVGPATETVALYRRLRAG